MPLLGELLDLVEQKKTLYSPVALKWLNWDESKQKYRLRHYLMEGEWADPVYYTIEEIKQYAYTNADKEKAIADHNAWIDQHPNDADNVDPPLEWDDTFAVAWQEYNRA